MTICVTF